MEINNLDYIGKNKRLFSYTVNNKKKYINFSVFKPYWSYADPDLLESCWAKIVDNNIIGILLGASNQTGIVFVWDAIQSKLIHVSCGDYAIASVIMDDYVYTLQEVHNFSTPSFFVLCRAKLFTMDASEYEDLLMTDDTSFLNKYNGYIGSLILFTENHSLKADIDDDIYGLPFSCE